MGDLKRPRQDEGDDRGKRGRPDPGYDAAFDKLPQETQAKLNELDAEGRVVRGDLDSRSLDALADFSSQDACDLLEQFAGQDLNVVRNKSAYLSGLMRRYRRYPEGVPPKQAVLQHGPLTLDSLPGPVRKTLESIFAEGSVIESDVDERCLEALIELPASLAVQTVEEFGRSSKSDNIRNKAAFFQSLLRKATDGTLRREPGKGGGKGYGGKGDYRGPDRGYDRYDDRRGGGYSRYDDRRDHRGGGGYRGGYHEEPMHQPAMGGGPPPPNPAINQALQGLQGTLLANGIGALMVPNMQGGFTTINLGQDGQPQTGAPLAPPGTLPPGTMAAPGGPDMYQQQPAGSMAMGMGAPIPSLMHLPPRLQQAAQEVIGQHEEAGQLLKSYPGIVEMLAELRANYGVVLDDKAWEVLLQLSENSGKGVLEEVRQALQSDTGVRNVSAYFTGIARKYMDAQAGTRDMPRRPDGRGGPGRIPPADDDLFNSLDGPVLQVLDSHMQKGLYERHWFDSRAVDALRRLRPEEAIELLEELANTDLNRIRNFAAYFMGMCKKYGGR
mmetsp:Transcript_20441/g.24542  ORF Transcript_20441/g.24542 Transcript_20441/m.24542 type:complete len:554 (-) Transcript_20441:1898-3559(-)|eukprot:CAMPEP_0197844036 /NCGR_PEP_ID=MMETSP1438-20131217/1005_1 /TAXON_ID=1461541 /ORGANISM="Pterosperma sp., Strain CCMP1384" /LENGTH=553 /DNA_ID=CAMNT_0043454577 /DNA_START=103 /DNA_END=1764 /DNA_ORIENTATION=+